MSVFLEAAVGSVGTAARSFRLVREPDGLEVCRKLKVALSRRERAQGLLGCESMRIDEGLLIPRCASVTTFFMRFPIALLYLDRSGRIMKKHPGLKAWRVSLCRGAENVIELHPAGPVMALGVGDLLVLCD